MTAQVDYCLCTIVKCLLHLSNDMNLVFFQPVLQDALARSVLRPAPVQPTLSVTDLPETVCVKVEEMTVNKV